MRSPRCSDNYKPEVIHYCTCIVSLRLNPRFHLAFQCIRLEIFDPRKYLLQFQHLAGSFRLPSFLNYLLIICFRAFKEKIRLAPYILYKTHSFLYQADKSLKLTYIMMKTLNPCLLYTSDAADEEDSVDLGG